MNRLAILGSFAGAIALLTCAAPARAATGELIAVDTTIDSNDPRFQQCTPAPDDCSLRGAISKSNQSVHVHYTVLLPAGTYPLALAGHDDDNAAGDLDAWGDITLIGDGASATVINANGIDRVLHAHSGAALEIGWVTLTGGHAADSNSTGPAENGGGVYVESEAALVMEYARLTGNSSGNGIAGFSYPDGGHGGGMIVVAGGTIDLRHTAVTSNTAGIGANEKNDLPSGNGGSGGGIYSNGTVSLTDSLVADNASGKGGDGQSPATEGICSTGDGGNGGGVASDSVLAVSRSTIQGNTSGTGGSVMCFIFSTYFGKPGDGGGIYNRGISSLAGITVEGNATAGGGDGGGMFLGGMAVLTGSLISGNTTGTTLNGGRGGGLYLSGLVTVTSSIITHNTTGDGRSGGYKSPYGFGGDGGGVYIDAASSAAVISNVICWNRTGNGGAIIVPPGGTYGGDGGGIMDAAAYLLAARNIVCANTAGDGHSDWVPADPDIVGGGGNGGGIALVGRAADLVNNQVSGNASGRDLSNRTYLDGRGSALYIAGDAVRLAHNTLAGNTGHTNEGIHVEGSSAAWLTNTILVSHTVGITVANASTVSLHSTLWGAGAWANGTNWAGGGTIVRQDDRFALPGFARPETNNYHLLATSPAVDAGVNAGVNDDLDGEPRPNPNTAIPDIGADEYWFRPRDANNRYLPLIFR